MINFKKTIFFLTLFMISCLEIYAKLLLPDVLSDNLILQQNSLVRLWGKAIPNSEVNINASWNNVKSNVIASKDSTWEVFLKTNNAGGPYQITIKNAGTVRVLKNVLLGEVWICAGQSNMEMPLKGYFSQPVNGALDAIIESENFSQIRMFTGKRAISDKKEFNLKGSWIEASISTTADFSAVGYFYARELTKTLKVPIGILNINYGGSNIQAWMSLDNLKMFPEFDVSQIDINSKTPQRIPTALYNAMFFPISKYSVKGVIWYQGESNVREPELFSRIFPAMVNEWRENIENKELPFYYTQIAPYKYDGSGKITSALLREAQQNCLNFISNSGMVVTMDIGNEKSIHPAEKEIVGKRLSYIALAKTYLYDKVPYLYPVYKEKELISNKIILTFENTENGFIPTNEPLKGFEIAGSDGVFYSAKAIIKSYNQIEVWADSVTNAVNARYCFKNYQVGNLVNSYGIPATSFRTDIK